MVSPHVSKPEGQHNDISFRAHRLGSVTVSAIMSIKPIDPKGYAALLAQLQQCIGSARLQAALSVNRELILLYWGIGRDIFARQAREGWGSKMIERLAFDLHRAFPKMTGLSARNLNYMRAFAEAWPDQAIVQQVAAQFRLGLIDRKFSTAKFTKSCRETALQSSCCSTGASLRLAGRGSSRVLD
jgi:hypothetical protein